VCVAPLQLEGLRGKKSTPSIGWKVPVESHRSESGNETDHAGQQLGAVTLGYSRKDFIFHFRLLVILHFHFCYVILKKSVYIAF
jgi:hypothetical protein